MVWGVTLRNNKAEFCLTVYEVVDMEIMITIQPWKDSKSALEIVKGLSTLQIRKARVNLKTLYRPEHLQELFNFLCNIREIDDNIEWYFDIGLPGDTLRLMIPKPPYYISVVAGNKLKIFFDNCNNFEEENDIYIRKTCNPVLFGDLLFAGDTFLYGDGEIEFRVINISERFVEVMALNQGDIWDGKAIYTRNNVITQYDSLSYLLQYIDSISGKNRNALICSLTENPKDIIEIKSKSSMKIISKIETISGIEQIENLAKVSDGIMLGRGDLFMHSGNCLQYFYLQQRFLDYISDNLSLNSIVATDILDSMNTNIVPSRSDITDVFYLLKYHPRVVFLSSTLFYSQNLSTCISVLNEISTYYEKSKRPTM